MNCVTLYLMLYNHQHYIVLDLGCDGQFNVKMSLVQSWRCPKPLVLLSKWTEFQTTSPLFCIQISHPTAMEFDQWTLWNWINVALLSKWKEFHTTSPLLCMHEQTQIQISHPTAMDLDQCSAVQLLFFIFFCQFQHNICFYKSSPNVFHKLSTKLFFLSTSHLAYSFFAILAQLYSFYKFRPNYIYQLSLTFMFNSVFIHS